MLGTRELVINLHDNVRWERKADALIPARFSEDGGVDSNHFGIHVYQRPSRVTGIDGCIGLDEMLKLSAVVDVPAFGRNNTGGGALFKGKKGTQREHPNPKTQPKGGGPVRGRQRTRKVDFC